MGHEMFYSTFKLCVIYGFFCGPQLVLESFYSQTQGLNSRNHLQDFFPMAALARDVFF